MVSCEYIEPQISDYLFLVCVCLLQLVDCEWGGSGSEAEFASIICFFKIAAYPES